MEALNLAKRRYTTEEYFKLLAESDHKLEYVDGDIQLMAGGSINHSRLVENAFFNLRMNRGNCSVRSSELAVSIASLNRYYFPDVSAVCGADEKYEDEKGIARILNPCLIVEVLSESTAEKDRSEKFNAYRRLESFREYILIDSRKLSVDTFYRETNDLWHIRSYYKADQQLEIRTLGTKVLISELYEGVVFTEVEEKLGF